MKAETQPAPAGILAQQYGCGSSIDDDGGGSPALQPAALGGAHQGAVGGARRLAAASDHERPGGDGREEPVRSREEGGPPHGREADCIGSPPHQADGETGVLGIRWYPTFKQYAEQFTVHRQFWELCMKQTKQDKVLEERRASL